MKKITFNRSSGPTIGVELEVQLLDPETLELVPLAPDILKKVPQELKDRIKPEFIQSMVEINTDVCSTVAEVEKDLKGTYNKLNDIAEGLGTVLSLSSIHPFSKSSDQKVSEKLRYKKIMDELQLVGRQFITQGLHVHIGVTDEEEAIKINNNLRIYLPVLLALTASSPFYESEDTGLMSYRSKLFEALPFAGMPDSLDGWDEYTRLVTLLKKSRVIESVKDIWWDVRPHPYFGTIEVRICDLPCFFRDVLAITALIQALVVALADQFENPEPHIQILRSNKWQAARHGLDGFYMDPFLGKKYTMREAATYLYKHVKPVAKELGSTDYLNGIPGILEHSTSASIQKNLYYSNGRDFIGMIRSMQGLFFK